jgi:hypothetical protein
MEKEKEKELVELYEAAKKAADASTSTDDIPSEETRCLDALEQLKNFPVNYKILVNTQVIIFLFTLQILVSLIFNYFLCKFLYYFYFHVAYLICFACYSC